MGGVSGKDTGEGPAYLTDDAVAATNAEHLEGLSYSGVRPRPALARVTSSAKGDTIPTVFRWQHGGHDVYVTGTFNNWQEQACRMYPSGHDFTFILDLPRGKHAYKFLVDGKWRFAPEQQKAADANGHIHNYIDLTTFKTHEESEAIRLETIEREGSVTGGVYGKVVPDIYGYTNEPPHLPPQLRQIILNQKPSNDTITTSSLPDPQGVTLNHLYCTAMKHGLMVLGTSIRYRRKYTTIVHYSVAK